MKLFELMSLGDNNGLGRVLHDARSNVTKFLKTSDKETQTVARNLIASIDAIESNANILHTDGYSLLNYLQQIANPKVGKRTLQNVCDALGSYNDSDGE